MSQAVRGSFLFFKGSSQGGTQPRESAFKTEDGDASSSMIACASLVRKTVEIRGAAADFGGRAVIIEGTISEGATDKAHWFPVSPTISAPGLYTLLVDQVNGPLYYEPELTWLRIRAVPSELGAVFPASIAATLAAVYEGPRWDCRVKGKLGNPIDHDYMGV